MAHRTRTTSSRAPIPAPSALGLVVGGLLLGLVAGCSGDPEGIDRADPPTVTVTPHSAPSSTAPPPTRKPTRTPTPTVSPSPSRDTVGTASSTQLRGLVRVVASIGNGRGETSTGMVLTSDGSVVTNNHGVEGATAVQVTVMTTGRAYGASIVATDPTNDVALLRLSGAAGLATVLPADRPAALGDRVTVVGGDSRTARPAFTAATGSVLALDQSLVATARTGSRERLDGLLLSTCDVAAGDSGGPTYNSRGQVVAMTTATIPRLGRIDGVSIPISTVLRVVRTLER